MALLEQINNDIKASMLSRNMLRLNTLRMLKSKILAIDARGNIPDADILKLIKNYLGSLEEALEQTKVANRPDAIENLEKEIVIVQEFLPKALSPEETKKIVTQAIVESGAKSKHDIGLVMKALKKLNAPIDGKLAKDLADQLLS